ncbi:MAG: lysophospholipase and related esterase [Ferruginibacter sp.]|uniref:GDSL-type esterase/lipase family protein n=1 Tax=Ferruginibacter sp. TaxID=1940288 RepID=UPI0026587A17|nr:GDSL-type esterase/lipase family protein [Ferruginibacter sp.]MDB5276425.1 lysophospholipase and related esterase [Ferruginibacter sp.]
MVKIFVASLLLVAVTSCSKKEVQSVSPVPVVTVPPRVPPAVLDSGTCSYLALGDSYTIGQSVALEDRYPMQTAAMLLADSIKMDVPEIIARTGWTTRNLLNGIFANPPARSTYSFVSLLIGVNNQFQHLPIEWYHDEFKTLLNIAISYAGNNPKRVFVLSVPDYSVTPKAGNLNQAAIAEEIDLYNSINNQIASARGCNYINITAASRQVVNNPSLIALDGLHYSGEEYKKWASLLTEAMEASLH